MSESPQESVAPEQKPSAREVAVAVVFRQVLATGIRCSFQNGKLIYPEHALHPDWYPDVVARLLEESGVEAEFVQVSGATMIKVTDWHASAPNGGNR